MLLSRHKVQFVRVFHSPIPKLTLLCVTAVGACPCDLGWLVKHV